MACGSSNNDPQIVAQHYFDVIECLNGKFVCESLLNLLKFYRSSLYIAH